MTAYHQNRQLFSRLGDECVGWPCNPLGGVLHVSNNHLSFPSQTVRFGSQWYHLSTSGWKNKKKTLDMTTILVRGSYFVPSKSCMRVWISHACAMNAWRKYIIHVVYNLGHSLMDNSTPISLWHNIIPGVSTAFIEPLPWEGNYIDKQNKNNLSRSSDSLWLRSFLKHPVLWWNFSDSGALIATPNSLNIPIIPSSYWPLITPTLLKVKRPPTGFNTSTHPPGCCSKTTHLRIRHNAKGKRPLRVGWSTKRMEETNLRLINNSLGSNTELGLSWR